MKKLKLEDLDVATFEVTPEAERSAGTVVAHEGSMEACSGAYCTTTDTRWDCSIDFCTHGCPWPTDPTYTE